MRTLTEFNRGRVGMMGAVVTVLVVGVAQSFTSVPMLFATPTYYAQFADTGGINTGDKVEIAGVNVGLVRSLAIRGNRVLIGFSLPGKTIGMQSRAAIRTDTGDRTPRFGAVETQRFPAVGADHYAIPNL